MPNRSAVRFWGAALIFMAAAGAHVRHKDLHPGASWRRWHRYSCPLRERVLCADGPVLVDTGARDVAELNALGINFVQSEEMTIDHHVARHSLRRGDIRHAVHTHNVFRRRTECQIDWIMASVRLRSLNANLSASRYLPKASTATTGDRSKASC